MSFKEVTGRYDGPALENEVLEFWREHDTFAKTLQQNEGGPQFSFNEGPPTANGKPGGWPRVGLLRILIERLQVRILSLSLGNVAQW